MSASTLIPLLEKVKDMLAVKQDGPGTQQKPSQNNKASTSAAKTRLAELVAKSTKDAAKVHATGSKRK